MEQLAILTNRKKKSLSEGQPGAKRLTRNSKIIKTIIAAIQEKKGENIVSLDLRKINEAVADFFIVCEAGNHHEGYNNLHWVLIDYVNVVVHVLLPENRKFYRLEEMWSDAVSQEHND